MIIHKDFVRSIDILDVKDLYSTEFEGVVLRLLTEKYVGRCFARCLILNIAKITRLSETMLSLPATNALASVNVAFDAEVLEYQRGDLILDGKIVQIDSSHIFLDSKFASIKISYEKMLPIFVEQTIMPVMVIDSRYSVGSTKVSVVAEVFMPRVPDAVVFQIDGQDDAECSKLLGEIDKFEKKIATAKAKNPKAHAFFVEMLYPYAENVEFKDTNFKKISFDNLAQSCVDGVYITRPQQMQRHERFAYVGNKQAQTATYTTTKSGAVKYILNDYLLHIYKLYELMVYFDTNIAEYKQFWALFKKMKLKPSED